jgi:hypothetical protein
MSMTRMGAAGATRRELPALAQRFATSVLAREVLRDVASVLAEEGIPVMPLKGVLFQLVLYADPAERALLDVDVLVRPRDFERAIRALLRAGFQPRSAGQSLIECALWSPRGMLVDLHRQLFSRGRYRLGAQAVFRRAAVDERLLGVPLHIAHPHDTAAHLIGKFVADHEGTDPAQRLDELRLWAQRFGLDPWRLGRHLAACGMTRAAHYTFTRGAQLSGEPFFSTALAALPPDRLARTYSRLAASLMSTLAPSSLAPLPAHLLNSSLARGGLSLALSALERARFAWLTRQGGGVTGMWSPFFGNRKALSEAARQCGRAVPKEQPSSAH